MDLKYKGMETVFLAVAHVDERLPRLGGQALKGELEGDVGHIQR